MNVVKRKSRIQVFNISVEDNCDQCAYGSYSDLFSGEALCDNPIDSHILYPEHNGKEKCEFIKLDEAIPF